MAFEIALAKQRLLLLCLNMDAGVIRKNIDYLEADILAVIHVTIPRVAEADNQFKIR